MKATRGGLMLALALAGGFATRALAEDLPLPTLYKNLADRNHYAVAEGLKEAQADVKCGILDQLIAAFPDAAGKPITVKYTWSRPDPNAAPTRKFVISGIPETVPDLTSRASTLFKENEDFVIPDPDYAPIVSTNATAANEAGKVTVKGTAKSPSDQIKGLVAEIDATTWQFKKIDLDLGAAHVIIETTRKDLGGKWGVETSTIQFPQYKKVIRYEYAQAGEFSLPSKLTVELVGPDGKELRPSYVYEFSNWQATK
jgi:hypothetical protein